MSINTNDLQSLYVAYFNRPADPNGLAFWENALATGRATLADVSASFATAAEYKAEYANKTPAQIITQVYLNLFGHQPDLPGLQFWTTQMAAGNVTIDKVVAQVAAGAQNEDTVAFQSKTAAAVAFTESLNTIEEVIAYESAAAQAVAKNFISGVRDAATLQTATTTENLNKVTQEVVASGNPDAAAVLAAKAAYETAAAATASAITDATAKATVATEAAAKITAAQAAAATAQTKAEATDAEALKTAAAAAKTASDNAANAKVVADANVVTFQKAYDAAIQGNDANAVTTAFGNLQIAQARATTAAKAATDAAAALTAAQAKADAAVADDTAAADAAKAVTAAVTAATGAAADAVAAATKATAAAATGATAAAAYATAAGKTADSTDNVAAAAAVAAATTASTNAASAATKATAANDIVQKVLVDAQGQIEVAAAKSAYTAALATASADATAAATAATTADAAIKNADSLEDANVAIAAAAAEATAAAKAKASADALAAAAAAYVAAANKTVATDDNTAAAAAVTAANAAVATANTAVADAAADVTAAAALPGTFVAKTVTLTEKVEHVTGSAGADVFFATDADLTLDVLDGKGGNDTLVFSDTTGGQGLDRLGLTLTSIETLEVRSVSEVAIDTTNFDSITAVNVMKGEIVGVTAGEATNVSVTGATETITVAGGKDVTVNDASSNQDIIIGDFENGVFATGNITVTDTKQDGGSIYVAGGQNVTVTTSSTKDVSADEEVAPSTGAIQVGFGEDAQPSGIVAITQNLTSKGDSLSGGDILAMGGTSVNVTVNGSITADAQGDNENTLTAGEIYVVGNGDTTQVSITQNLKATDWAKAGEASVKETKAITFKALASGQSTTVGGLTFTATKALSAEQVAQAFANLTKSDTQTATGPTANGFYSGTFSSSWLSAAAAGATVTFTGAADDVDDLGFSSTGTTQPTFVYTEGKEAGDRLSADVGVEYSNVYIDESSDAGIQSVTLNGFANAVLGMDSSLDALKTVSLANAEGDTYITTQQATLALTVNNVYGAVSDESESIKTLTVTATGEASEIALNAVNVTNLTVDAQVDLGLAESSAMAGLKTVTVKGAGAVDLGDMSASVALDTFNASANTGGVVATIETDVDSLTGKITEYVFSAGNDNVTLNSTDIDTAITLGAGNDKLTLAEGTEKAAKAIDGGAGTNTIGIYAADAEFLSESAAFELKMSNFSKLSIADVVDGSYTVDLANLDDISYVITKGTSNAFEATGVTFDAAKRTVAMGASDAVSITVGGVVYTVKGGGANTTVDAAMTALATAIAADYRVQSASYTNGALLVTSKTGVALQLGDLVSTKDLDATTEVISSQLVFDNMANNGTIELTAAGTGAIVNLADASGSADVLNVVTKDLGGVNVGSVIANGVETISIATTDTFTDLDGDGVDDVNSTGNLYVGGDALGLVKVSGAGDLSLDANSAALKTVDGSAMSGKLTFAARADGLVVMGGSTGDSLTVYADDVRLVGGAGGDTFNVMAGADRAKLEGGAGKDTFSIQGASSTQNTYAVINGLDSGDTIKFTGGTSFAATKVTLSAGATETTQAYLTQAIAALKSGEMGWFQFGGNTYIVMDAGTDGQTFVDGQDFVVMITGQVDLSTASFNAIKGLEIA